jgi:hypothetical protein
VVLVDGELTLYLAAGRRKLSVVQRKNLDRAVRQGLCQLADEKTLRVSEINGEPARTSALADIFRAAGFTDEARGLVLERYR